MSAFENGILFGWFGLAGVIFQVLKNYINYTLIIYVLIIIICRFYVSKCYLKRKEFYGCSSLEMPLLHWDAF